MPDTHPMSLWEFLDRLTEGRRWGAIVGLALVMSLSLLLVFAGGAKIARYFWPGGIEIVPSAGSIRFLQENRQYKMQLVHPFGWQTTDVHFGVGQTAEVSAGGMVTVGYIEQFWDNFSYRAGERCMEVKGRYAKPLPDCIKGRTEARRPPKARWPWVGPAGYDPKMYADPEYEWAPFTGERAKGIMVDGVPHGSLVGHIRAEGQAMLPDETVSKSEVYELGKTTAVTAKQAGVLWVAVNDAGPYFHDNLGSFSLTVSTRPEK